jgi:heterodisulfide reductase subunit A
MATLIIDGQAYPAQEGQTVLEVARENGIEIPTLCYHPLLEPFGACRLCTVEVIRHGRTRLETSCTYPAWDGLEIKTHSPAVMEIRKVILGLMLSRCPNVPLLQDMAREYGVTEPPFPTDTPDEKCILCGLCVRTCRDVVKANVLNFSQRGIERRVGPAFLERADECIGCGACTIVCPTGAIEIALEKEAIYVAKPTGPTAAIHVPSLQAVPRVPVIDTDACIRFRQQDLSEGEIADACGVCQQLCEVGAIDFEQEDEIIEFEVGAIVVATGFKMWNPTQLPDYGYGKSPNIITGLEFEALTGAAGPTAGEIVTADGKKPEKVAIIHCVGSRDERGHAYCSRFCCMYSLKQAHQVKDKTGAEVYSIYMDMRTFGKDYEEFYRRIRDEGIQFVQGRPSQVTVDPVTGKIFISVEDILLGRVLELEVDMVVLATAIEPPADADRIATTFGLGRTPDGWFAEAHPKLKPVESASAGVFLAGCAQGPRDVPDTVAHAGAAALEAVRLFNQGEVTISPTVAVVDALKCVGCGECIPVCPYTAIARGADAKAQVNAALCQGCGTCVATCPSGAITALHFTNQEIVAQIDGLLELVV